MERASAGEAEDPGSNPWLHGGGRRKQSKVPCSVQCKELASGATFDFKKYQYGLF